MANTINIGSSSANANINIAGNLILDAGAGTTTTDDSSILRLGNATASGTAGNNYGVVRICGKGAYYGQIFDKDNILTANRSYYLPNKTGTIALTSDLTSASDAVEEISDKISTLGTYKVVAEASTSLSAATTKAVKSISLAAGTWIVTANVRVTTPMLCINFCTTSGSATFSAETGFRVGTSSSSSAEYVVSRTRILKPTSSTTYYLNVYSTAAATAYYQIEAVRII